MLDPEDYLQWGWANSPNAFDLETLDVRYDRSASGPAQLEIHLAVNGGAFESILHDQEVDVSGESLLGMDLSRFDAVNSATFRLYGYAASRSSGTFDLENFAMDPNYAVAVNGTATSVPEPGGLAILLTLGVGTAVTARARRTRSN